MEKPKRGRPKKTQLDDVIQREQEVIRLRRQGMQWDDIAKAVGYSAPSTAYEVYQRALKRIVKEDVEAIRELENTRLDTALSAIWPQVLAGDLPAVQTLIKVMDRRAKLNGLDMPTRIQAEVVSYDGNTVRAELERILAIAGDSRASGVVAEGFGAGESASS